MRGRGSVRHAPYLLNPLKQSVTQAWDDAFGLLVQPSRPHHCVGLARACGRQRQVWRQQDSSSQTCLPICKYAGIVAFKRVVQNVHSKSIKHKLLAWGRGRVVSSVLLAERGNSLWNFGLVSSTDQKQWSNANVWRWKRHAVSRQLGPPAATHPCCTPLAARGQHTHTHTSQKWRTLIEAHPPLKDGLVAFHVHNAGGAAFYL